jgi:hypothetical protein
LRRGAALLLVALAVPACGGEPEARAPVVRETQEDDILRVGRTWVADLQDTGFRTPPSRVRMFKRRTQSTVTFTRGVRTAQEAVVFDETFTLSDGSTYHCQAQTTLAVPVAFGDHAGESAVELRRPALHLPRTCDQAGLPEPTLDLEPAAARFALRGDRLVPIAPPTERRSYLPAP